MRRRWAELNEIFRKSDETGQFQGFDPDPDDDEVDLETVELGARLGGLQLTTTGWLVLERALADSWLNAHPLLLERTKKIMDLGQFDTAVREACVILETELKSLAKSQQYGERLLNALFKRDELNCLFFPSFLRVMRTEIRAVFKFVRNEFMHNRRELEANQCSAILARISKLLYDLDEMTVAIGEHKHA